MPATNYDDPLLFMTDAEIARRNVRMGISESNPEPDPDENGCIWDAIESGNLSMLTKRLLK